MLWACENSGCGCRFAVGLAACPQCGGTRVTVAGLEGRSNPVLSTKTGKPIPGVKRAKSGGEQDNGEDGGQQAGGSGEDAGK